MLVQNRDKRVDAQEDSSTELLRLLDAHVDREVQLHLQAPKGYQDKFIGRLEQGLEKLSYAVEGILERSLREDLNQLVTWLKAITRSCKNDPSDLDVEVALPMIVGQIAEAAEDYAEAISTPRARAHHSATLRSFEREIREVRLPWAKALLDKMSLNDHLPAAERLTLSTSFFKQQ